MGSVLRTPSHPKQPGLSLAGIRLAGTPSHRSGFPVLRGGMQSGSVLGQGARSGINFIMSSKPASWMA